jgi:hypothetical protein
MSGTSLRSRSDRLKSQADAPAISASISSTSNVEAASSALRV